MSFCESKPGLFMGKTKQQHSPENESTRQGTQQTATKFSGRNSLTNYRTSKLLSPTSQTGVKQPAFSHTKRSSPVNTVNELPDIISRDNSPTPGTDFSRTGIYKKNYTINASNDLINSRQNQHYVGYYYKGLVQKNVLKTKRPSPVLKQEEKAVRRYKSPFQKVAKDKQDSRYFFRSKSFLNSSKFPPLQPKDSDLGVTVEKVGLESQKDPDSEAEGQLEEGEIG